MDKIIEFAPFILIIFMFFLQNRLFVTPEQLEKKHREIIGDLEDKFVSLPAYLGFREQVLNELKRATDGIDEIKEFLMKRRQGD